MDKKTGKVISGHFNSDFDTEQLRDIAFNAGGNYYSVENMADFSSAIASIAKEQILAQSYHVHTTDTYFTSVFILGAIIFVLLAWVIRRMYLEELL